MQQTQPSLGQMIFEEPESDPANLAKEAVFKHYYIEGQMVPDPYVEITREIIDRNGDVRKRFEPFFEQMPPESQKTNISLMQTLANGIQGLEGLFDLNPTRILNELKEKAFSPLLALKPEQERPVPMIKMDVHAYVCHVDGKWFVFGGSEPVFADLDYLPKYWGDIIAGSRNIKQEDVVEKHSPMWEYHPRIVERIESGEFEQCLVRDENGNPDTITVKIQSYAPLALCSTNTNLEPKPIDYQITEPQPSADADTECLSSVPNQPVQQIESVPSASQSTSAPTSKPVTTQPATSQPASRPVEYPTTAPVSSIFGEAQSNYLRSSDLELILNEAEVQLVIGKEDYAPKHNLGDYVGLAGMAFAGIAMVIAAGNVWGYYRGKRRPRITGPN